MRTAILAALVLWVGGATVAAQPVTRTVYVTVTDGQGAPVQGLTGADFVVKEGGKEREIVKAEPPTAKMHLALLVEERLIADGGVRMGLYEFMKRVIQEAEISLITVGLRNQTLVDYTSSPDALVDALNRLSLNPNPNSNMTEGIREAARAIEADHAERPVLVVVAISGGQAGGAPSKDVLDAVRQSRVVMHSVTLSGGDTNNGDVSSLGDASNREHVLGDGPKQSGGRRLEIVTTSATQKALQQVAGDLLAQYAISYTLPDGVKPDKRFSASVKRKGASLRAPNVIADRADR
jgi:VWFA-related protein